jgi:hypothetical protein
MGSLINQPIKGKEESMELSSKLSWLTERISCDQFDLFANNVACRLKQMKPDVAATAQMKIQRVLTSVARDQKSNVNLSCIPFNLYTLHYIQMAF